MTTMRKLFHERLDQLAARLDDMVVLVENAMRDATTALFTADPALAESVLDGHEELKAQQAAVDELALDLLARQQPVAGDLRAIVACLRMSVDLRRMGKLAAHIAEIARDRDPDPPVPAPLWEAVRAMSERALALFAEAAHAVSTRDAGAATRLDHEDDQVDRLQQDLYGRLLAKTPGLDAEMVVDLALIGRYYERFADHAVDLGRGIGYLTGRNALDASMGTR
jgi:phosphate transport system protein